MTRCSRFRNVYQHVHSRDSAHVDEKSRYLGRSADSAAKSCCCGIAARRKPAPTQQTQLRIARERQVTDATACAQDAVVGRVDEGGEEAVRRCGCSEHRMRGVCCRHRAARWRRHHGVFHSTSAHAQLHASAHRARARQQSCR